MANDWIRMRINLREDPAVISIAHLTGLDEDTVVGKLHRLWSWADAHVTLLSRNGHAAVTQLWIDRYIGAPGFAEAMQKTGWLNIEETSISFPNFERYNGQAAKKRGLAANRKQAERSRSCHADVTQNTRPEKRREEKSINTPQPPKGEVESASFEVFWEVFPSGRKQGKGAAWRAWQVAIKKTSAQLIIDAAREYAASPVGQGQYVKGPVPWLNQGCWSDDRTAWQRSDTTGRSPPPALFAGPAAFAAEEQRDQN
jgi:hypothetical protein